jgi:hypothetical protein
MLNDSTPRQADGLCSFDFWAFNFLDQTIERLSDSKTIEGFHVLIFNVNAIMFFAFSVKV